MGSVYSQVWYVDLPSYCSIHHEGKHAEVSAEVAQVSCITCSRMCHEEDAEGQGLQRRMANEADLAGASQIAATGVDCEGEDAKGHVDDDCVNV